MPLFREIAVSLYQTARRCYTFISTKKAVSMMLRKDDILRIVAGYGFAREDFWLMTGASLVLQGIREETHDIDLGVSRALFERLKAEGHTPFVDEDGDRKIVLDEYTEVFPEWRPQAVETVCGLPCATLESTLAIKRKLGRPKDRADIARIEAELARRAGQ